MAAPLTPSDGDSHLVLLGTRVTSIAIAVIPTIDDRARARDPVLGIDQTVVASRWILLSADRRALG